MLKDLIETPLVAIQRIPDLWRSLNSDSLIRYTQVTRAEPLVMIDPMVTTLPYIKDVLLSLTSIYAGYYLQAIAISVNVGSVDTISLLEKVNPSRNPSEALGQLAYNSLSMESNYYKLPKYTVVPALEASNYADPDVTPPTTVTAGKDAVKSVTQVDNLAVGAMIEVNIEQDGNKAVIPITIRLITVPMPRQPMKNLLISSAADNSMVERWHGMKSGRLNLVMDNVLVTDLVDAHRKSLMKDSTGIYAAILSRRNKNRLAGLLSGNPSVSTASNIMVIASDLVSSIESEIGGRLTNFQIRQRIFEGTYLMLMVIIDPSDEQVTIYHRGIAQPTKVTAKMMKSANKGGGSDIGEILQAYQLGREPSI